MNDDWRLRIDLHDDDHAVALSDRLQAADLEHDLATAFRDRVVVSRDGSEVFCYTGTAQQAQEAEKVVRTLAAEHGWSLDTELTRWHPAEEQWEDPAKPLNSVAEHEALIEQERQEAQRGDPEFEVRIQCSSHGEARALAEKLAAEGIPNVHRWRYLLVSALDEDSAGALAERLRAEAPADSTITVEGTGKAALNELPANPFAFLGGLAG